MLKNCSQTTAQTLFKQSPLITSQSLRVLGHMLCLTTGVLFSSQVFAAFLTTWKHIPDVFKRHVLTLSNLAF